jgi:DNA (cytosine-5)-methyltransferase 1
LVFDEVQADLEAEGYEVFPVVLPACAVNAPHRRDRVWFIAYRTNSRCEHGQVYNGWSKEKARCREVSNEPRNTGKSWPTTNPNGNGLNQRNGEHEEQPGKGGFNALSNADTGDEYGDVADTESQSSERLRLKLGEFSESEQGKFGGTHSQMGNNVADTDGIGLRGESNGTGKSRFIGKTSAPTDWTDFPTVSPICGKYDGLSSRLDGITFSKWRNESIKAYGNAVVPQVVFQIFKAIEQMTTQQTL